MKDLIEFKIVIPDAVFQKIMWWIHKTHHEVSGFGSLDYDAATGVFTVRDAILLKQEVGPAMTEIDPVSMGKAMFEQRAEPNALKWHWHSHVNMGVFWSSDDMTLIRQLGSQGWILATVFNKKHEMKSAFLTTMQIKTNFLETNKNRELFVDDIPTKVQRYIEPELYEKWDKEFAEHVNVRPLPTYPTYTGPSVGKPGFVAFAKRETKGLPLNGAIVHGGADHTADGLRWSYVYTRWVYNPLYDLSVNKEEDIVKAILTMDKEEVQSADTYYKDRDSKFLAYYKEACKIQKPLFEDVQHKKYDYEGQGYDAMGFHI